MTKPNFTASYPLIYATIASKHAKNEVYQKGVFDKFQNWTIPEINAALEAGQIIVADSKTLRERINKFIEAAFTMIIWDRFTFAGKWQSLPADLRELDNVYEARMIGAFEKKLMKCTSVDHLMYQLGKELVKELKELADVVAYLKTIEVKATDVRAKAKAEKEAADALKNATDPVYQAVLPLKKMAEDRTEQGVRDSIRQGLVRLEAAGFDLDTVAPYPQPQPYDRDKRQAVDLERSFYLSFCDWDKVRVDVDNAVVPNAEKIEEEVRKARKMAAYQFEAYVAKLNTKIGDKVKTAELHGNPWVGSTLTVETEAKGRQVWHTQMILNVSKLGKLFNQFPTRLKK